MSTETISLENIRLTGSGLVRPECVLCTARGDIYTADWRGGVAHIQPDRSQYLYTGKAPDGRELRPNGIALLADGSFLIADLGADLGGVFRMTRAGEVSIVLDTIDGSALPPTNFVFVDAKGRTWITVSTRKSPRSLAYRSDVADGFIILVDHQGARIVADGLGYTNEAAVSPDGTWLYVNETFGRRLSRFPLFTDGKLGPRQTVTEFGAGDYPDGLVFDVEGHVWITSIVSNRIIRVAPDGRQTLMLEDAEEAHLAWAEAAFVAGELGRPHLDNIRSQQLKNISSLAFGGPDLKTAYLGCLLGDSLARLSMPVAGLPPTHWNY